jgi:hypothetical protein
MLMGQTSAKISAFGRMSAGDFNELLKSGAISPAGSGKRTGKRRVQVEEMLHCECFDWVFRHESAYPVLRWVFHSPNGGARNKAEGGKLKAMGARKGVVDVISPFPGPGGSGLALELKAPGKKPTPDQAEFLAKAAEHDWVHGVCYSLEEFQRLVRQYMGVPPSVRMI